jgi:hypothetical protein
MAMRQQQQALERAAAKPATVTTSAYLFNQPSLSQAEASTDFGFDESLEKFAMLDFSSSTDTELAFWTNSGADLFADLERLIFSPLITSHKRLHSVAELTAKPLNKASVPLFEEKQQRSTRTKRVRVAVEEDVESMDGESLTESDSDYSQPAHRRDSTSAHVGGNGTHTGETRLRINFVNRGVLGEVPQYFGKSGHVVPDGVCGTHEVYDQPWQFEINHERQQGTNVVLVVWKITNLTSGTVTVVKETPQQANLREFSGRTICNKVVKLALNNRAKELEASLPTMTGSRRIAVEGAIKALRPRLCTIGLLFFGLLHENLQAELKSKRLD